MPPPTYVWIPGREPGLVLIHGLGSFGRCFRDAPQSPGLRGRAILIPDLPGFGGNPAPEGFSFTMQAQAEWLADICRSAGLRRIAIVGHSMGGAVGILLAEIWTGGVTHFACAVGNLVPEDCFFSRKIAEMGETAFAARGFRKYAEAFRPREGGTVPPSSTYYESLQMTSAQAMYRSSVDLVRLSDDGDLLGRFLALPCRKIYLRDTENPIAPHLEEALRTASVPIASIPRTGHALMEDDPGQFYSALAAFLEETT